MSSKAKQVLLWLMIISSALLFVWFLQSKQTKNPQDLTIDLAITRIKNKEFKEASFKQSQVEFLDGAGNKFVTTIGSDATREQFLKVVNDFNEANPSASIKTTEETLWTGSAEGTLSPTRVCPAS